MKPFEGLTPQGKVRRLRRVALNALAAYDVDVARLRLLAVHTNTLFDVRASNGARYVLRISTEYDSGETDNEVELFWLERLQGVPGLNVVQPLPRRDGGMLTWATAAGVPGARRCVLFAWVPGRHLENSLSTIRYRQLGETMARLHNHAETLNPLPATLRPKRWDRVFYYPQEPVVYTDPAYGHLFSADQIAVMDAVVTRANRLLAELQSPPFQPMLIHGDLHFWNVHLHRGQLHVLDFEDVMLGTPAQDVAITLYYGQERDQFADWCVAFQEGYTALRAWPVRSEDELQTLWAARRAMFVNYVAHTDVVDDPAAFIASRCESLREYLDRVGD